MKNHMSTRRTFLKQIGFCAAATLVPDFSSAAKSTSKPNVILCMTDDQGWGDVAYNGHPDIKTPALDAMSTSGIRFDRFYAAAPVCSPTRGSVVTGRHPFRYGIFYANTGYMLPQEITIAEAVKTQGYTTGHFGKWHMGTLTTKIKDSNRGKPGNTAIFSPPQANGFDVCFSTEAKVPTWDQMVKKAGAKKHIVTHYFNEKGDVVTDNLKGDDSRVIMDRAIPFIENAAKNESPFLAIIWFHTPHLPVIAGPKYLDMYKGHPGAHYLGCITAMDEQMGRLRKKLKDLNIADDTMLFFCSDNGPEGRRKTPANGSAGHFSGRKRSLYEGGIRVPGLLEWPAKIKKNRVVDMPCCTSDYFPTIMDILGIKMQDQPTPIDGISLLPLIEGKMEQRPVPIGFQSRGKIALSDNRYKIYSNNGGKTYRLFDLLEDPSEKIDLAKQKPEVVKKMQKTLERWRKSCRDSMAGKDYEGNIEI